IIKLLSFFVRSIQRRQESPFFSFIPISCKNVMQEDSLPVTPGITGSFAYCKSLYTGLFSRPK
ncbi:MAG: hypothetical protein L0Y61_06390, partial [Epsilonproteobacteria bacterium]|nr:hypothetical protein [Campylobacterota bacterium]